MSLDQGDGFPKIRKGMRKFGPVPPAEIEPAGSLSSEDIEPAGSLSSEDIEPAGSLSSEDIEPAGSLSSEDIEPADLPPPVSFLVNSYQKNLIDIKNQPSNVINLPLPGWRSTVEYGVTSAVVVEAVVVEAVVVSTPVEAKSTVQTPDQASPLSPDDKFKNDLYALLKERGADVDKVSLDGIASVVNQVLKRDVELSDKAQVEEQEKMLADIAQKVMLALQQEKGVVPPAQVVTVGSGPVSVAGSTNDSGSIATGLVAASGAMIGGLASLGIGSLNLMGSAAGAAGRGLGGLMKTPESPASRFDGIITMQAITEYRVNAVEKAADGYESAVKNFWELPSMEPVFKDIKERARTAGVSVPDAMKKMKPGGEFADLHDKFVADSSSCPDAVKAKVAMDRALSSYTKQYDHSSEALLPADMDVPSNRDAKNRVDATKSKMEKLSELSPVFGGETESHAERFQAAIKAIIQKIKEMFQAIGGTSAHKEAAHAGP